MIPQRYRDDLQKVFGPEADVVAIFRRPTGWWMRMELKNQYVEFCLGREAACGIETARKSLERSQPEFVAAFERRQKAFASYVDACARGDHEEMDRLEPEVKRWVDAA